MSVIVVRRRRPVRGRGPARPGRALAGHRRPDRAAQRPPPALLRLARALVRGPTPTRAGMAAHVLTDEAFALVLPAFRALGRHDPGPTSSPSRVTFVPWIDRHRRGHARRASSCPTLARWASTSCSRPPWPAWRWPSWSTAARSWRLVAARSSASRVALWPARRWASWRAGSWGPRSPCWCRETAARDRGRRGVDHGHAGGCRERRAGRARRPHGCGHLSVARACRCCCPASIACRPSRTSTCGSSARASSRRSPRSTCWCSPMTRARTRLHLGVELLAVLVCVAVVAWRRSLLLGLIAAVRAGGRGSRRWASR